MTTDPRPTVADETPTLTCRHCNRLLKPCNCGAGGKTHWIDIQQRKPWEFDPPPVGSRWCHPPTQPHEPTETGS